MINVLRNLSVGSFELLNFKILLKGVLNFLINELFRVLISVKIFSTSITTKCCCALLRISRSSLQSKNRRRHNRFKKKTQRCMLSHRVLLSLPLFFVFSCTDCFSTHLRFSTKLIQFNCFVVSCQRRGKLISIIFLLPKIPFTHIKRFSDVFFFLEMFL